jgi:hypothetical protein
LCRHRDATRDSVSPASPVSLFSKLLYRTEGRGPAQPRPRIYPDHPSSETCGCIFPASLQSEGRRQIFSPPTVYTTAFTAPPDFQRRSSFLSRSTGRDAMTSDQAQRDPVNGTTEPLLPGEEESAGDVGATPSADGLSRPSHGWFRELRELLYLSASIFVLRVSWVVIKTTDSALLGDDPLTALRQTNARLYPSFLLLPTQPFQPTSETFFSTDRTLVISLRVFLNISIAPRYFSETRITLPLAPSFNFGRLHRHAVPGCRLHQRPVDPVHGRVHHGRRPRNVLQSGDRFGEQTDGGHLAAGNSPNSTLHIMLAWLL